MLNPLARRARGPVVCPITARSSGVRLRAAVETLEIRRLLATVSWDGGGDGTNWSSANNWSTNVVPGGSDDVTIDVPGAATIRVTDGRSVNSLVNRETLEVAGVGANAAYLQVFNGATNYGAIRLSSTGTGYAYFYGSTSTANGIVGLTNAAGATITAVAGAGTGALNISSSLNNLGTITAEAGRSLLLNLGGARFAQAGTIAAAAGADIAINNADLLQTGGGYVGTVRARSSTLTLTGSAAAGGTLRLTASNYLVAHTAPNLTLLVDAINNEYSYLYTQNRDVTVSGPIRLTSTNDNVNAGTTSPAPYVSIGGGSTLTIAAGGSITGIAGTGTGASTLRYIDGTTNSVLVNNGTISAAASGLTLNVTPQRTDQNGTITAASGASIGIQASTAFNYLGGTNTGDVLLNAGTINLANASVPTTIVAHGTSTLAGFAASNITLIERYDPGFGGELDVRDDVALSGAIILTSSTTSGASIYLYAGATLTVSAGASITAGVGTGTNVTRAINGTTNSRLVNNGTIVADPGIALTLNPATVDQNGALVATNNVNGVGTILLSPGRTNYLAGGTNSSGVYLQGGDANLAGSNGPQTIYARGGNNLVGFDAANLTVVLQYEPAFGGSLNVTQDANLAGTLVMQTTTTSPPSLSIGAARTLTVTSTGTIRGSQGTGTSTARAIDGSTNSRLINNGTIVADANTTLAINTQRFVQAGGLLTTLGSGLLNISPGDFTYAGGTHTNNVFATSPGILRLVAASVPTTLIVRGNSTLASHSGTNLSLVLQYEPSFGGSLNINDPITITRPITLTSTTTSGPTLNINNDVTFAGAVTLTTGGSGIPRINIGQAGATVTIATGGSIVAAASGAGTTASRTIDGTTLTRIVNHGTISAADGVTLNVGNSIVDHDGSLVTAGAGQIVFGVDRFNYNGGTSDAGSILASSTDVYLNAAAAPTTISGTANIDLYGFNAANVTLAFAYRPSFGGTINVPQNLTVSGTITLGTTTTSPPNVQIAQGATLTIATGGAIRAVAGTGVGAATQRSLSGSTNSRLVNFGTLAADAGVTLNVGVARLDEYGTISGAGTGQVVVTSTEFRYLGGTNNASGLLLTGGAGVTLAASSGPVSIMTTGNIDLRGFNNPNATLLYDYGPSGSSYINVPVDVTVNGAIVMTSSTGSDPSIYLSAGVNLTIAPTGSLLAGIGTGTSNARSIYGTTNATLTNRGQIRVETGRTLSLALPTFNTGTLIVDASPVASGISGSYAFNNQPGGVIRKTGAGSTTFSKDIVNTGLVDVVGGTLRFTGATNLSDPVGAFLSGGTYHVASGTTLGFGGSPAQQPALNTADVEVTGTGIVEFGRLTDNRGRIALLGGAAVAVDPDGTARFVNEGILDLSPGSVLTITGGLDFAGTGQPIVRTEIASATSFGRINVTGSVDLNSPDSTSRFDPDLVNGYDPTPGSRHDVITATAGVINAFDSFFGGPTPGGNTLLLLRPNANVVAVGVGTGAAPPAPQILSQAFEYETREALVFTFNQDVSAFLSRKDYSITNLTTNAVVAQSAGTLTYNATSNQAVLVVTGELPDGRYRLSIQAGDIANAAGVPLTTPLTFDFFVLRGDANRDAAVNFSDLLILAQNYGSTGRTFSQGNVDYSPDGAVGFSDLLQLAQQYGKSLPALATGQSAGPIARGRDDRTIADDVLA